VSTEATAFRTPEQVAQRIGLSRKAIYRAIERGELTAYRLCGRLRITTTDEQAWIEHNRVMPAVTDVLPAEQPPPELTGHRIRSTRLSPLEQARESRLLRPVERGVGHPA